MPSCKSGYILRKSSRVKSYTKKDGTRVKGSRRASVCVPDKGKKGKTKASQKVLPKLKQGGLGKYGLKNLESMKVSERMEKYEKAIKKEGYADIVGRLNVLANYTKRSNPKFHDLVKKDMARIKKKFAGKYSKSIKGSRSSSRKNDKTKSSKPKQVKAGIYTMRDGTKRQLYRLQGSDSEYYRYKSSDGTFKKRYI